MLLRTSEQLLKEIRGLVAEREPMIRGRVRGKLLVAEMTNRNPNVFYELGLAHALDKPVVLVSSNEEDVPFDLKHIRVEPFGIGVVDPFKRLPQGR